jgi:hypothetical protein
MPVKNICECNNPPGGRAVCEPHQMAVCGIINGVVRRECLDPPSGGTPAMLVNWALDQISGRSPGANAQITGRDLETLVRGTHSAPNGDIVNFVAPPQIIDAVRSLQSQLQSQSQRTYKQSGSR